MIQKINIFSAGWIRNRIFDIKYLIHAIYFRYPIKLIWYNIIGLMSLGLVYPLARIILGREKAHKVRQAYLDIFLSGFTVPLPPPLKSKIATIDGSNYTNYYGIFIRDMYLQEFLKAGMNVIDVGANIGFYTALASEKVGRHGKLVAIEPETKNYKRLIENMETNDLQNVIPVKMALLDHCGSEKLYLHRFSVSHSLLLQEDKSHLVCVQTTTLDKLTEELDIKKIDMIKINAEGGELSILKGAENVLKANLNAKIILLCDHYPSEKDEVCQFLNERGFKTKTYYENIVATV